MARRHYVDKPMLLCYSECSQRTDARIPVTEG